MSMESVIMVGRKILAMKSSRHNVEHNRQGGGGLKHICLTRIKCGMGFHEFVKRVAIFITRENGKEPWKIWERRCVHCGYSPTWER